MTYASTAAKRNCCLLPPSFHLWYFYPWGNINNLSLGETARASNTLIIKTGILVYTFYWKTIQTEWAAFELSCSISALQHLHPRREDYEPSIMSTDQAVSVFSNWIKWYKTKRLSVTKKNWKKKKKPHIGRCVLSCRYIARLWECGQNNPMSYLVISTIWQK